MILIITPEQTIPDETNLINQLFHEGLELLHIRKPLLSREEMKNFISKIDESFYSQLVLHSHHDLGNEFQISRFHVRETDRKEGKYKPFIDGNIISTSVHDIETYNTLEKEWDYAFISPFFPSISKKGYGEDSTVLEDIQRRNNPDVKLIALGGIHQDNIQKAFDKGADGVVLLGAIWEDDDPIHIFKRCRKNVLS